MIEPQPEEGREINPYASPSSGSRSVESDWPTLLDFVEAAVLLSFSYAALVGLLFLTDHDFFYFMLYFCPAFPAGLAAQRYRQRQLRNPTLHFAVMISLELTALAVTPNYFVANQWSMTGHPLFEIGIGVVVTFFVCFMSQRSDRFWNLQR